MASLIKTNFVKTYLVNLAVIFKFTCNVHQPLMVSRINWVESLFYKFNWDRSRLESQPICIISILQQIANTKLY